MGILQPIYAQDPARVAAITLSGEIDFARLCGDIDRTACWMAGNGLAPGDRVSLHVSHRGCPGYGDWILHLGAIRAGLVHTTGEFRPAIDRIRALGKRKAAIGKVDPDHGFSCKVLPLDLLAADPFDGLTVQESDLPPFEAETRAVRLLATSGTTGRPKVIAWDHALLQHRLRQARKVGGLDAETRLLPLLGYQTTAGFRYPLATWQAGGCVLFPGTAEIDVADEAIAMRSNVVLVSPYRLRQMLAAMPAPWSDREGRTVKLFGGRLPLQLRDRTGAQVGTKVEVNYGSTESGSVASGDAAVIERNPGAVGFVVPGAKVEIVGRGGVLLPPGNEGVVRLRSAGLIGGYVMGPGDAQGRSPLRDGWFYPGDLGILYEDGLLAITGRISETLNFGGAKIVPGPLEAAICELPEVEDVCLLTMPLDEGDMLAVAVKCDSRVVMPQLRGKIVEKTGMKWNFALIRVQQIPRNAMGKLMRRQLAAQVTSGFKRNWPARQAADG